ncbi:MAG: hypothetical protein AAGF98_02035, partial [Cyanobacteria bacterium P01_H01_bin.153]
EYLKRPFLVDKLNLSTKQKYENRQKRVVFLFSGDFDSRGIDKEALVVAAAGLAPSEASRFLTEWLE